MNRNLNLWLCCFCLAMMGLFYGCHPKYSGNGDVELFRAEQVHPLIVAYTGGRVAAQTEFRVQFTDDPLMVKPLPGEETASTLFSFSPKVQGKTYWINERTVAFKPDEPLRHDQTYEVTVHVAQVADTRDMNEDFTYAVHTFPLTFTTSLSSWQMYRDNRSVYYMERVVETSDQVDDATLEQILTVYENGQKKPIHWQHDASKKSHVARVDSIPALTAVKWEWTGDPLSFDWEETETFTSPNPDQWNVVDVSVRYRPEFAVIVTCSAPLLTSQKPTDFITWSDGTGMRYTIDRNRVYLYPLERKQGEQLLTLYEGLQNDRQEKLSADTTVKLFLENMEPAVEFVTQGMLIPSTNQWVMPFKSIHFTSVDVRVTRFYPQNLLDFVQEYGLDDDYALYRVQDIVYEKNMLLGDPSDATLHQWHTYALDLSDLISPDPGAVYRVFLRGKQPLVTQKDEYESDYYFGSYNTRKDRIRTVLASDLGLVVKGSESLGYRAEVSSILTLEPLAGVKVIYYDVQNRVIARGTTRSDGIWETQLSRKPSMVVAQKDRQSGYLPLDDGQSLSLSTFDVDGTLSASGIKGMIYGERGVWRPGDSLFLTFVLSDKLQTLPEHHPVQMQLRNPMGQLVGQQTKTRSENGMYAFKWAVDSNAPTGLWQAEVQLGGSTFTKGIKIETIKPNRLKIDTQVETVGEGQQGTISAQWLTGLKAARLRATVEVTLSATPTVFSDYPSYVFDHPVKKFKTERHQIFQGELSETGEAYFSNTLSDLTSSSGMLHADYDIRVFETGGNFSIDHCATTYSPYKAYVGLKTEQEEESSDTYSWPLQKDVPFEVVVVDAAGKPVTTAKSVQLRIYKVDWDWWWNVSQGSTDARFMHDHSATLFKQMTIPLEKGKGKVNLRFETGEDGRYFVECATEVSSHTSGLIAMVDAYGMSEEDQSLATQLLFASDKPKYQVGETALFQMEAPQDAVALITVETGTAVLQSFRQKANDGKVSFEVPITEEMSPNAYVYVSLIQPYGQFHSDAPLRMYGVIPLMVEDANRLNPQIAVPATIKPETPFEVQIREQQERAMSYTLAVVDEGLLGLTRFETPDPQKFFYAKEALGIKTWDVYDKVMGAYAGKIEQLFAIGGDDESDVVITPMVQRFEPVVRYLGPFTLAAGKTQRHKVTLPPYVGMVRVMVVASDGTAFGAAEQQVEVKKPLMVLSTLPRRVGTNEEIQLPVTVLVTDQSVQEVQVKVSTNNRFTVVDDAPKTVKMDHETEKTVYFTLKTSSETGEGVVTVSASASSDEAQQTTSLMVQDPNPTMYASVFKAIGAEQTETLTLAWPGRMGTNTAVLALSTLPALNLEQRLSYLLNYPHGCLEQTVSAAFPQLYLTTLSAALTQMQKDKAEGYVEDALQKLTRFVTSSGGFAYWPGLSQAHTWGTSYAGLFMLEAERLGYALPAGLKESWIRYQKNRVQTWDAENVSDLDHAYALYTLAQSKNSDRSAMNRLRTKSGLSVPAQWVLAAAYVSDGQTDVARQMVTSLSYKLSNVPLAPGTLGSVDRDRALLLEVLTTLRMSQPAFELSQQLSEALSSTAYMSTQTTACALKALATYRAAYRPDSVSSVGAVLRWGTPQVSQNFAEKSGEVSVTLDASKMSGKTDFSIQNTNKNTLFAVLTASGIPEAGTERSYNENVRMEVAYEKVDGTPLAVQSLPLTEDFMAVITLTHTALVRGDYENLVLTQIVPSGWEILNPRMYGSASLAASSYDYQDVRDDRVYTYFSLKAGERKTFRTHLTTSYAGKFYAPAITCEAMYDASVRAAQQGFECEVK